MGSTALKPAPSAPSATYIALVGAANLDISARADAHTVAGDSNPGSIACSPGGVARNVAENLLRLHVDARLISVLGEDAFGQVLRQSAQRIGLCLQACHSIATARTATYLSMHDADGEMAVAVNDMDILEHLTPGLLARHTQLLHGAAALVLDSNLRPDALAWLVQQFPGKPLFAEAVSVAKCSKLLPLFPALHTLKANRIEAQALCGNTIHSPQDAMQAAWQLHQRGPGHVVISLGAEGAAWCDAKGRTGHYAARPLHMVSATGAGDALLSGLIYGFLQGMVLEQALPWAMASAELTLSSTFANSPQLSVQAVQARLTSTRFS